MVAWRAMGREEARVVARVVVVGVEACRQAGQEGCEGEGAVEAAVKAKEVAVRAAAAERVEEGEVVREAAAAAGARAAVRAMEAARLGEGAVKVGGCLRREGHGYRNRHSRCPESIRRTAMHMRDAQVWSACICKYTSKPTRPANPALYPCILVPLYPCTLVPSPPFPMHGVSPRHRRHRRRSRHLRCSHMWYCSSSEEARAARAADRAERAGQCMK